MANIKSAKKRIRVIDKKTARNRRVKGHLKAVLKAFDAAIEAGDMEGCTVEEIAAITPQSLWASYQTLLSTARVEIFYVGCKSHEELEALCKETLPFAGRAADFPTTVLGDLPQESRTVTEQMRISQCKMTLGFRTEYTLQKGNLPAMTMFNEVFGGSPNSRLFMNVREKQSLCYYCSSFPDGLKGLLMVVSGIEQKNKQKTLDAVLEQLEDIRKGNVTEQEMENARRSLRNGYREITDSPAAISSWYLGRISTGRYESPEDAILSMEQVTKEDVIKVANEIRLDTVYFLEGGAQA